jgi:CRISPR-associated endonuclease Cas1/CRISPR-associated protein Cas4
MTMETPPLVPARMLNEHVYCRRLAYLEWVDARFIDNQDTVEGRFAHRRVDATRGAPPEPGEDGGEARPPSTSVWLSSDELGLSAKIDLLESRGETVTPVEYKHGRPRSAEQPLWEPERIQLCAQVLLLRASGYRVQEAEVYFEGSRSRHLIPIDDELVQAATEAVAQLRADAALSEPPPPLVDSPKCPRCSLVGLCLPDEVSQLGGVRSPPARRLVAGDNPAQPLYLTEQGATLTKRGARLVLLHEGAEIASRRLLDVSHIGVFGNASVRSAALRACFEAGVQVLWFSYGGWFAGFAGPLSGGSVELRARQHRAAAIGAPELAAAFVAGKIRNCRTLLRRHGGEAVRPLLGQLAALAAHAEKERRLDALLGLEGTAARLYFSNFAGLFAHARSPGTFDFEGRNRRPPLDPINALLSFAYAMLIKDTTVALVAAGLDPYVGMYHRPRFGRPALALDLAEEFRPLIADSAVLRAINNGEIDAGDFIHRAGAVSLTPAGRKRMIASYERRMTDELLHPVFEYRASYRRTLEIQARMLAATLVGDVDEYRSLTTR